MQRSTEHSRSSPTGDEGRFLAGAISWNALFSAASGVLLLVGGFAFNSWLGVDAWLLMGVGGGLILFAGLLLWLLSQPRHLAAGARLVVAADAAWVAGAVLLLAWLPSALSPAGRMALAVVTAIVAAVAAAQLVGLRRLRSGPVTGTSPLALRVQRIIAAPAQQVWHAVADAGDYARFVRGIAASAIVSGEGQGMVRLCTDDRGRQWAESCTLWEEGTRYRMTVDVDSYPIYYQMLLHEFSQTWTVEPTARGTRLTLAFDGAVKLGVLGRLAARVLGNPRRLEAILDAYERDLTSEHRLAER
jgi:ribosome-associated toxin RatA of RatAB toxin-antitoxin module